MMDDFVNTLRGMRLSPTLGWPLGIALAALMTGMALGCVVTYVRTRKSETDLTVAMTVRRTLMCLLVAVMVLTPCTVETSDAMAVNATDVVIATDVTGSMAVNDAHYGTSSAVTRLDAAKSAVADLTDLYPNSAFSALHFGAQAGMDVPLTPDTGAIKSWAEGLKPEATDLSAGSTLDVPLNQLIDDLKSIRSSHAHDTIVLYLITDGEQTSPKQRRSFSALRQYLDNAFVIGVGSTKGGRIPRIGTDQTDAQSAETPTQPNDWVTDPSTGQPGVSTMDVKELNALADEMSGHTVVTGSSRTLGKSDTVRSSQWNIAKTPRRRQRLNPVVWPFAIALLVLLTWEAASWLSTSRRLL